MIFPSIQIHTIKNKTVLAQQEMVYTVVENKRVMRFVLDIQKGLCYFCKKEITPTDSVISRGVGRQKKKYYHNKCARIVHIIT
jgi:hypothetical protein